MKLINNSRPSGFLKTSGFWILYCVWSVLTGWALTFIHQLSLIGYLFSFIGFVAFASIFIKRNRGSFLSSGCLWNRWKWRARHPLFLIYLTLVLLIITGGIIYSPTQYDGLCYRVPRMLHWIEDGKWSWMHTIDGRMNLAAANFEWISMPLLVLTKTDRWLWIPNLVSFLILPGLVFGMFHELGVSPRAAWCWMWLLPSGFCFVTQAGSIGNDLPAVPFALASVYFALRARRGGYRDLVLSLLSAAMLTGMKASNIPLFLPAAVAALPSLYLFLKKPLSSAVVLVVAMAVSFLPIALMNHLHAGHWTGDRDNTSGMRISSPSAGLLGNGIMLTLASFQPPLLHAKGITKSWVHFILGESLEEKLRHEFPKFSSGLEEMPTEEGSGLGMGLTIALITSILLQLLATGGTAQRILLPVIVLLSGFISLAVYMVKMGNDSAARLLTPYYPICLAGLWLLFVRRQDVVRLKPWRWIALFGASLAIPVLILSPARPLWPAITIMEKLQSYCPSTVVNRATNVYKTYRLRNRALDPVVRSLPPGSRIIGFAGEGGELETAMWWPLGTRKIVHVLPGDTVQGVSNKGIQVICTNRRALTNLWHLTPESFAARFNGNIIALPKATQTVAWGEEEWVVVLLGKQPDNTLIRGSNHSSRDGYP